jgi:UDP-N-acetylglucosamine acyltransferase
MAAIDATARVADGARIGNDVEIGPYCLVGPDVELKDGVRLISHVSITGVTTIGEGTLVYPFASLGTPPQSVHYHGESTKLIVGPGCQVRENVTMNTGTVGGGGVTRVGARCFFMVSSHVAHDCDVGDDVTFANNAVIGGHASIGNNVFLGGNCAVHQFCRIGEGVMLSGLSGAGTDIGCGLLIVRCSAGTACSPTGSSPWRRSLPTIHLYKKRSPSFVPAASGR